VILGDLRRLEIVFLLRHFKSKRCLSFEEKLRGEKVAG